MKTRHLVMVVGILVLCSMLRQGAVGGTLQIIRSIELPRDSFLSSDLAWDGQHLWTSMISTHGFAYSATLEIDPSDGSIVSSFGYNGDLDRRGHTWDGDFLWITSNTANVNNVPHGSPPDDSPDYVYKFAADGTLISAFSPPHAPDAITTGATWDGSSLWLSDRKHREIMRLDPADMSVIASFPSPSTAPCGLTWDGTSLWSVDAADGLIYQMDAFGNVLETWSTPLTDPYGITFDGENFWVLDNDAQKIFQLQVPEPATFTMLLIAAAALLLRSRNRCKSAAYRLK